MRPRVRQQAAIDLRGVERRRTGGSVHFAGVGSSTVAMLMRTKPSLPSTSMALTTD